VRRISNPRPRKIATPAADKPIESAEMIGADAATPPATPQFPESSESATSGDEQETETTQATTGEPREHPKRKRRRKKGKGHQPQVTGNQSEEDSPSPENHEALEAVAPSVAGPAAVAASVAGPTHHPIHTPRVKIEPEVLATRAWKIYLSEVSEEGVALIGDTDAKDLARRCFRLAEIFIEEQMRRR
jgi:hypothetical protein